MPDPDWPASNSAHWHFWDVDRRQIHAATPLTPQAWIEVEAAAWSVYETRRLTVVEGQILQSLFPNVLAGVRPEKTSGPVTLGALATNLRRSVDLARLHGDAIHQHAVVTARHVYRAAMEAVESSGPGEPMK